MQAQRLKTKRTFKALKDVYSAGNDICQQLNDDTRDIFKTRDRYRSAVLSFVNMHLKPTSKSSVPLKTSTLIFTRQNKVKVLREMWC